MQWQTLIDQVVQLARTASAVIPQAGAAADAVEIGNKIVDLVQDLTNSTDDVETQKELATVRLQLREAVSRKAQQTASGLEGKG